MKSQGWCDEARLQVSEEGAVSGRLMRDGGAVSVTSVAMRRPVWIEEMARYGVMGEMGMVVEGKERGWGA
jgi:hypothetical protein